MDKLAPEVFEQILVQIGGRAFVSIRQTCKRLKMLADKMEMSLKPCIWYRYTHDEFSIPCIQSVLLPWLEYNDENLDKDNFIWKTIYSCLLRSQIRSPFSFEFKVLDSELSNLIHMFFVGQQLICCGKNKIVCVGIPREGVTRQVMPITSVKFNDYTDRLMPPLTYQVLNDQGLDKDKVIYKPLNIADQTSSFVDCCKETVKRIITAQANGSLQQQKPHALLSKMRTSDLANKGHEKLHEFAFEMNQSCPCENELYGTEVTSGPDNCVKYVCSEDLATGVCSLRMMENLLLCLYENQRGLHTNTMHSDKHGKISLGQWRKLDVCHLINERDDITGFDVAGQTFVAITLYCNVLVSNLEDSTHECLHRNMVMALDLSMDHQAFIKVCVDVNDGLVIAILDSFMKVILLFVGNTT